MAVLVALDEVEHQVPDVEGPTPHSMDVVFITESKELLSSELRVVVCDNGVRNSKAMDNVKEEQHGLLRLDRGD